MFGERYRWSEFIMNEGQKQYNINTVNVLDRALVVYTNTLKFQAIIV